MQAAGNNGYSDDSSIVCGHTSHRSEIFSIDLLQDFGLFHLTDSF